MLTNRVVEVVFLIIFYLLKFILIISFYFIFIETIMSFKQVMYNHPLTRVSKIQKKSSQVWEKSKRIHKRVGKK